ncbi:MAG: GNAT family protein [Pseudomonadota bacterium]
MSPNDLAEPLYPRPLSGAEVPNPPPALVPPRIELKGQYVTLEPQNASRHAEELFEAGHENDDALKIWDYLAYGPWPSLDAYVQTIRQQSASFDPIFYAMRLNDTGIACGQGSIMDINAQFGTVEIGHIWFGLALQGSRAGTEALYLMIKHSMDDLGYRRMQWRCNSMNAKSRAAARRLGFRFEGIFHNHMIFKGRNRDTAWYSILDDEWPEVRDILQTWLAPANFDASGKAKTSLGAEMQKRAPGDRPQ